MSNTISALLEETCQLEKQLDSLEAGIDLMQKMSTRSSVDALSDKLNMLSRSAPAGNTLSSSVRDSDSTSANMKKMLAEMLSENRKIAGAVSDLKEELTAFREAGESRREAVTI